MTKIQTATPQIIRCIRPNIDRKPLHFVPEYVLAQMRYTGITETIKIKKHGYCSRLKFRDFLVVYETLRTFLVPPHSMIPDEQKCQEVIRYCGLNTNSASHKIGKSKVFFHEEDLRKIDQVSNEVKKKIVLCQSAVRRYLAKKRFAELQKISMVKNETKVQELCHQMALQHDKVTSWIWFQREHDEVKVHKNPVNPEEAALQESLESLDDILDQYDEVTGNRSGNRSGQCHTYISIIVCLTVCMTGNRSGNQFGQCHTYISITACLTVGMTGNRSGNRSGQCHTYISIIVCLTVFMTGNRSGNRSGQCHTYISIIVCLSVCMTGNRSGNRSGQCHTYISIIVCLTVGMTGNRSGQCHTYISIIVCLTVGMTGNRSGNRSGQCHTYISIIACLTVGMTGNWLETGLVSVLLISQSLSVCLSVRMTGNRSGQCHTYISIIVCLSVCMTGNRSGQCHTYISIIACLTVGMTGNRSGNRSGQCPTYISIIVCLTVGMTGNRSGQCHTYISIIVCLSVCMTGNRSVSRYNTYYSLDQCFLESVLLRNVFYFGSVLAILSTVFGSMSKAKLHDLNSKRRTALTVSGPGAIYLLSNIPILHRIWNCEWTDGIAHHLKQMASMFGVCFFYSTKLPERLSPGTFDFIGNSHQIFHILFVLCTQNHLDGVVWDINFRQTFVVRRPPPSLWNIFGIIALICLADILTMKYFYSRFKKRCLKKDTNSNELKAKTNG
ncbi:uncharacterized protein LOC134278767 [Saccostrea cucullata]|uniref:uncharacterized protein LOC134278767 n=1 Tax=Saccostrea cuccullata TaxID=36930 RepID=UPI002ED1C3D0